MLIKIIGISIEILAFPFKILGISKKYDNRIPCVWRYGLKEDQSFKISDFGNFGINYVSSKNW